MPVRSSALGAELPPVVTHVTARMTLAYAAGIGDVGSRTFDDADHESLVAPPPFCVRLEWPVLLQGRGSVLGLSEAERLRAVHVEQDSRFHRPIRPGDRLATRGRIVAIRATRAGALVETRLSTRTADFDEAVVTSWHATIYRGVGVEGEDGRLEEPPSVPAAAEMPRTLAIPIAREAAHVYSECADIWNPIHSERRVALSVGLPDVILHGTATWALAGREIVKAYADGDPTRLLRLRGSFKAPVVPGGAIALFHGPGDPGDVHFRVANAQGETALAGGYAQLES